ncbi:MAG TPA: alpha-ketoglutarate-dependent dioxygenase AlkB, partial [Lysobacter sp.]|nr:alpha-ketoglutarate-dependent dioxygenase AlkB [Lysobacter sp.]
MSAYQANLFDSDVRVLAEDAEGGIVYRPNMVEATKAQHWFEALRDGIAWQAQRRPMYDRVVDVPRLTAAFRLASDNLPAPLAEAAAFVRTYTGEPFNAVGLNYYRDGRDSVASHNGKLHILVPHHPIALLSLGAPRRMTIRTKQVSWTPIRIDLEPGSLLMMSYDSQLHY